jgi:hypothetical protein
MRFIIAIIANAIVNKLYISKTNKILKKKVKAE